MADQQPTFWSITLIDFGIFRDDPEDSITECRTIFTSQEAALAAAKADLIEWMLPDDDSDPDEIPVRQAIRDQVYRDSEWKAVGEDLVWGSGDGPDEILCRIYPVTVGG